MVQHGNHSPYRIYKNQKNQIGSSPPQYRSAPCRHSGEDCTKSFIFLHNKYLWFTILSTDTHITLSFLFQINQNEIQDEQVL